MAKKKKRKKGPSEPAPLDMGAIMRSGSDAAVRQIQEEYRQLIANYPKLERLSLGTVGRIAGQLDNEATRDAQSAIGRALALTRDEDADPTSIEQRLYADTERDLALGRSLSPEQIRDSQQSARAAFSARGLGTSMGSAAAEILNRDSMATRREAERRTAAAEANNLLMGNVMGRRGMMANNLYAGAGNLMQADPTTRAMPLGLGAAQNQQSMQMNQIGNAFSGANQMAGNIAGFNTNMQGSIYNSYQNNQAARQAANTAAGATRQAGLYSMIGNIFSDRRMKTDIKPMGEAGGVLGLKVYEYRYKGDDAKRVGFMAQDVKRVLPEAVQEVEHEGKRRLMIRPQVIGQALARELTRAAA